MYSTVRLQWKLTMNRCPTCAMYVLCLIEAKYLYLTSINYKQFINKLVYREI